MKLYATAFAIIFAVITTVITLVRLFTYFSVVYPQLFQGYNLAYIIAFGASAALALLVAIGEHQ